MGIQGNWWTYFPCALRESVPGRSIMHYCQEEIIFPRELKRFGYEEVTSLNVIGKQKICDFEKSDIVSFSEI